MLRRVFILWCFLVITKASFSQRAHDFLVGGAFDLIKTDNAGFVQKAQLGGEFNYFIAKKFTATGGLEFWKDNHVSFVVGGRWYPIEHFFTRARGLIGENDLSLGAGWNYPISNNFRFEAIGDFYFEGEFAARVGLMYLIRR